MAFLPCFSSCWRLLPLVLLPACSQGLTRRPPELPSDQQAHARISADPLRPLIVEWPASERVELEAKLRQGPVVVRYDGRTMRVLSRCQSPGTYAFQGTQTHRDSLLIDDQDTLKAQLPLGAASLSSSLNRLGTLQLHLTLIGAYASSEPEVARGALHGDCAGATHLVASVTVGAFELKTASNAAIGGGATVSGVGGGIESSSRRDVLARAGDLEACQAASPDAKAPPGGCGALVRLGLSPLVEPEPAPAPPTTTASAPPATASAPPTATSAAPPRPYRPEVAARPWPGTPPSTPPAEPPQRSSPWITVAGIGVGAVLVGAVIAGIVLQKKSDERSRDPVPTGGLGNASMPAVFRW